MIINHNIAALNTHRQMGSAQSAQMDSMEKLSSGLRINSAKDDAAGLTISEKMRGQIRGLEQASTNAQDSISLIQTAEGALNETQDILQRMRELAVQSSNDTYTDDDRKEIQEEVNELSKEISRIGNDTEFNTKKLSDGSFKATFQIGANQGQSLNLEINDMRGNALNITGVTEVTAGGAAPMAGTLTKASTDGTTQTANTIIDGSYTISEGAPGTLNLVDSNGATVATSSNGTTFTGGGTDTGGTPTQATEDLVFGSALTAGATVQVSASGATVSATPPVTLTNDKLEAGEYSVTSDGGTGFNLLASNGDTIGTSANGTTFVNADSETILTSSVALTAGTEFKVGGIDVSTRENAGAAITTINNAINTVSSERSKLGANQNRLDHTINNLNTSSENITAAESRIRDVDYTEAA
ncbi:flagellin [Planococcus sp. ANT_H30]|uniref:flagellin N-terminal helical domain-containing protein n=1 Tax=Planococcus sp. ANT_H30 TaxID=2597347 RepID=UPI0011ECADC3|nr:flagellin [Planococcus sp. ANT_H30]KAA0957472.1 flagellin [Planococcus sp. ANT_H30]